MNVNFYNELSYYCTPYIYDKFEYILTNKKQYLDGILNSPYKYHLMTHLSLIDFMYVFTKLEMNDIIYIFKQLCIYGYEHKIKFVCYHVEFHNSIGFDIEMIKLVIPHRNKNLVYFLIEYFQLEKFHNFSEIFYLIMLYDNLCLDVFINQLIHLNDLEIYNYIKQAIYMDRFKIFAYLIDLFKLDIKNKNKIWISYLIDIISLCITKNKREYIEYIHQINPLNTFFSGMTCINKIRTFKMYEYIRTRVIKKEVFDRRFLYEMIRQKYKCFIKKCVELNPYSICQYNHKAIHISSGSTQQFLIDIHPCGKEIKKIEQNTLDKVVDAVSLYSSNLITDE